MIPFCGYYICWYANLWDISFTKDVDWDQLLLCIEPHSCLMHQYLLDNSSDRVLCTTYIRVSSGHSRKLSSETVYNRQIHRHPFVSCLLSHANSFGSLSSSISFWGNSIIWTPLTNVLSYVLTGFEGEQTSWITAAIKYELKIRNRLWNTGAVTQDSLQNSS